MRQSGPEYAGALSLLALGAVLGPSSLGVLTPQLLTLIDPAIPVGLAILGVLAALNTDATRAARRAPPVKAFQDAAAAAAIAGTLAAIAFAFGLDGSRPWIVAGVAAACALATRLQHGGIPIVLGALALAWMGSAGLALWTVGNTVVVSVGCAAIGWIMLRRQSPGAEQGAVVVAMLFLIGGAAESLSVSALLGGFAAGLCWGLPRTTVRESVRQDVAYLRHPVLAILLLTAGAHAELSVVTIGLGVGYAAVSALLSHLAEALTAVTVAGSNILAIALALSAFRLGGPEMAVPLAAVVVGTMLLQALAISRGRTEVFE
jgi:hypothetical protein